MIFGKSVFTLGVYETSLRYANLTFTFKCGMPGSEFLLYYISQCCATCAWGTDLQLRPLVTVVAIWMGVMNCLHQMSGLLKLIHLTGRNHCDRTLNWIMILWNSKKPKHKFMGREGWVDVCFNGHKAQCLLFTNALLLLPLEIYIGKGAFPSSERQSCCSALWVPFPTVFYSFLIYNITWNLQTAVLHDSTSPWLWYDGHVLDQ